MTTPAIETVLAWHSALNLGDVAWLLSLSTEDVEVGGPRGAGHGHDLLRDWVGRARMRLKVRRVFASADVVVVDQSARWRSTDGDHMLSTDGSQDEAATLGGQHIRLTEPQEVASVFRLRDGLVSSVIRYPDLASAMQAVGLEQAHEQLPTPESAALPSGADAAELHG